MFENIAFNILSAHKVSRNRNYGFNANRNFHALSFRLSGEARFSYQNKNLGASTHSISYIPAHLDYTIESKNEELIILHLDVYNYDSNDIEIFDPSDYHIYLEMFENILSIWESRCSGYKHTCSSALYNIFSKIENQNNSALYTVGMPLYFKKSIDYINRNFTDHNISINFLAELAGVSDVYFRKIFYRHYGKNPLKYINDMRIAYACSLIQTKYYTINEVAEKSGFLDVKYFSTLFKKMMGIPPSEYIYQKPLKQLV